MNDFMQALKISDLNIPVPIIQGGMGVGVSLSGLASAVANEGGVGVISSAGLGLIYKDLSKDFLEASILGLREELRRSREKTLGVIGVNVMVAMTNFADMVKTAIDERADIIFSGAGMPLDLPKYLSSDSVTKLSPIVSSARAAKIISEKWYSAYSYLPDALVVEGPKAGGHLGFKFDQINDAEYRLEKILPEVKAAAMELEQKYGKSIPVVAAGGIYTGEDIFNIMQLGADGVQLGSRFVTTNECDASDAFKQMYINSKENDLEIIQSPVGMPGRVINNSFIEKVKMGLKQPIKCPFECIKTCDVQKSPYCIITALFNAFKGNLENGYAFAGSNAFKTERIKSVKETFSEMVNEFRDAVKTKFPNINIDN